MPWCDTCDVFVAEENAAADSACPDCDSELDTADLRDKPPPKAPWHFWAMVASAAGYLLYRLGQALLWALGNWV